VTSHGRPQREPASAAPRNRASDLGRHEDHARLAHAVAEDPSAAAVDYFERQLAPKSATSIGFALRAAREGMLAEAKRRLAAVEKLYLEDLMKTHDALEGLAAFLEKRPPGWKGR
jgi:cyclohexa-1,5-dienecarbonyl-CoA hydratase